MTDAALARRLATEAGSLLLAIRREDPVCGDRGDAEANSFLVRALRRERPDDAVLSEEATDDRIRLARRRVWIIDPVDGTREYAEGRDDWAVHVGLAVDGRATAGAVALPALGLAFCSEFPPSLAPPPPAPRIVVSRTRPPREAVAVADALGGALVPMGSAGAKAMAILRGEADIYLHSGGQHEWDSCAPVAVAQAAGLHCSRLDGRALAYNQPEPYLPDLLICRTEWTSRILDLLARG